MRRKHIWRRLRATACGLLASMVVGTALAEPHQRYVAFCAPGATRPTDCVHVLEIGPSAAGRVVVLVPGGSEGASTLEPTARYLTAALPDLQVWAVERREQNLMDLSHLADAAGSSYYFGAQYRKPSQGELVEARNWGLADAIGDLHRVVIAARGGDRHVFLGGHSWGASIALAYAAWDFDGRPGYRDLAGLILVDGGLHDSFAGEGYKFRLTAANAQNRLAVISEGNPFTGDLDYLWGIKGRPEEVPMLYQLAGSFAVRDPDGPSELADRLPDAMRPPEAVTNAALLGWLIDTHAPVGDLKAHSGVIDPHAAGAAGWISKGPAELGEIANAMAERDPAALEWYWPARLTLDLEAVDPFAVSDATELLKLPIAHARDIDVPLYVFSTGLTHGSVEASARWVVAHSRIAHAVYVTDDTMSHLDPLFDAPPRNKFLSTVAQFLAQER